MRKREPMTAKEFRWALLLAYIVGVTPVLVGIMSPWFLILPIAMIGIATEARVRHVNTVKRGEVDG